MKNIFASFLFFLAYSGVFVYTAIIKEAISNDSVFFWMSLMAVAAILSVYFGVRSIKEGKKAAGWTLITPGVVAFIYDAAFLILATIVSIGW